MNAWHMQRMQHFSFVMKLMTGLWEVKWRHVLWIKRGILLSV